MINNCQQLQWISKGENFEDVTLNNSIFVWDVSEDEGCNIIESLKSDSA